MEIRTERVTDLDGCEQCRGIAAQVWGSDAACSTAQMIVHALYGGVVLLAFDGNRPVGFLFSFPARYRGEWVLWSHETGVIPSYLHKGVGTLLKHEQRHIAREIGYSAIAWTFDPLVARNAHFNLNKLGARIAEYKENVYGVDNHDLVNQGVETDRFVAVWKTDASIRADHRSRIDVQSGDNTVLTLHGASPVVQLRAAMAEYVSTQIPWDFSNLIQTDRNAAMSWRNAFRTVAYRLLHDGYQPVAFRSENGTAHYIWGQGEI